MVCIPLSIQALFSQNPPVQIDKFQIFFENDKSELTSSEQAKLWDISVLLKTKKQNFTLYLSGNTDAIGSNTYNQALSERRSETVRQVLLANGIEPTFIRLESKGELSPIADNKSEEGKQRNRRVDLTVVWQMPIALPKPKPFVDASAFIEGMTKPIQNLEIVSSSTEKMIVTGEQGTELTFPAGAFDVPNGGKVAIQLKEVFLVSDMLTQNLSTHSDDNILASGGMIYVTSTYNGQRISPSKNYIIRIPRNEKTPDRTIVDTTTNPMQLFAGVRTNNGQLNWKLKSDQYLNPHGIEFRKWTYWNKYLTDTCGCNKMFTYRKTNDKNATGKLIYSDKYAAKGYVFHEVNKKDSLSTMCRELADWSVLAGYENTKATWKRKHRVMEADMIGSNGDFYKQMRVKRQKTDKITPHYNILLDSFAKKIDSLKVLYDQFERGRTVGSVAEETLYYIFETQQMGWINCDYFIRIDPETLVRCETDVPIDQLTFAKIVFKKRKVILNPNDSDSRFFAFKGVPKDEEVTLIMMKTDGEKTLLAIQDIKTANQKFAIKFESVTKETLKEKLKILDKS